MGRKALPTQLDNNFLSRRGLRLIPKKIGRNDPCWCGSGIKYKKCHLNREAQKSIDYWKVSKEFKDEFSVQKCCAPDSFHNECSKKIVKAHTVPKSSSLKAIARNGHVYGLAISLENIRRHDGKLIPELIGINRASTFSGFCNIHDDAIFAPIEKQEFSDLPEHCFLLAYRAFTRECYTKNAMANLSQLRKSLDKGKPIERQMDIQTIAFLMDIGVITAVKDNEHHKNIFDSYLENNDYSSVRALVLELDAAPPVMMSGAVNPDFDFNGNRIQDLMELEEIPDIISLTSFFDGSKGRIVFSWLENSHQSCKMLLESFLNKPEHELAKYVVQYMFNNFENVFVAPEWWEELKDVTKDEIVDLMFDNVSPDNEPNGVAISRAYLDILFPSIISIKPVNWSPSLMKPMDVRFD